MLPNPPVGSIFQQVGAPPHYSREDRALLDERLPDFCLERVVQRIGQPVRTILLLLNFWAGYVRCKV